MWSGLEQLKQVRLEEEGGGGGETGSPRMGMVMCALGRYE